MPQMAPISWLILYIMFSSSLMLFCLMNFFSTPLTPPSSKQMSISYNSFNWKW